MRAARALAYCALCTVVQGTVVEISAEGVKKAELEEQYVLGKTRYIIGLEIMTYLEHAYNPGSNATLIEWKNLQS